MNNKSRLLHKGPIEARRLSGRCSSGAERGKGRLFHAVPVGASQLRGVAWCGAKPGRLSGVGWQECEAGDGITCKRCLRQLMRHSAEEE